MLLTKVKTAADEHRSVNSMTKTYLPQIMRDFPEFSYEQFKIKAEHALLSALAAISNDNTGLMQDASEEFKTKGQVAYRDESGQRVR